MANEETTRSATPKREGARRLVHTLLNPLLVGTIGVFAALWQWHNVRSTIDMEARQRFGVKMERTRMAIEARMAAYADVLVSGATFFTIRDHVLRTEWGDYVARLFPAA